MSVLDLPAPEGAVVLAANKDVRPSMDAAAARYSSPLGQVVDEDRNGDQTAELAERLGTSERALRTAQSMLRRELAPRGGGQAGQMAARIEGPRRFELVSPGLVVEGESDVRERPAVGVALVADPLVVLVVGGRPAALHWAILPGGPTVTARADALRFIRSLAAGGSLTFGLGRGSELPPLEVDPGAWDDDDEWRLFEDLAVLEEWSGAKLPMPSHVSAAEATRAAQAASWVRAQQIDANLVEAIVVPASSYWTREPPDELRLHQEFGVQLFGIDILLGEGVARVRLRGLEASPNEQTYRARPASSELSFALRAPATRRLPPRRTQPIGVRGPQPAVAAGVGRRHEVRRRATKSIVEALRGRSPATLRGYESTDELLDDLRGE